MRYITFILSALIIVGASGLVYAQIAGGGGFDPGVIDVPITESYSFDHYEITSDIIVYEEDATFDLVAWNFQWTYRDVVHESMGTAFVTDAAGWSDIVSVVESESHKRIGIMVDGIMRQDYRPPTDRASPVMPENGWTPVETGGMVSVE